MSAGRPRKEVDRSQAEKLCSIQCTAVEISGFFGVTPDTLDNRCKEWGYKNFSDFFNEHGQGGKISLRRWQFKAAERGNSTMLLWLGKQYLGQSEKYEPYREEKYEEPETFKA